MANVIQYDVLEDTRSIHDILLANGYAHVRVPGSYEHRIFNPAGDFIGYMDAGAAVQLIKTLNEVK